MARSITFLAYVQGEIRPITLRAGETFQDRKHETTDEGWSRSTRTWTFDGSRVLRIADSDGVDCDGRMSQHEEHETTPADAAAGFQLPDGRRLALWHAVKGAARQRDYSAERMGY